VLTASPGLTKEKTVSVCLALPEEVNVPLRTRSEEEKKLFEDLSAFRATGSGSSSPTATMSTQPFSASVDYSGEQKKIVDLTKESVNFYPGWSKNPLWKQYAQSVANNTEHLLNYRAGEPHMNERYIYIYIYI
jgi:hypothetical protein